MRLLRFFLIVLLGPCTVGCVMFAHEKGGMDFFKEKCSFVEAVTALKEGHSIRRNKGYLGPYTSAEVNVNGKVVRQYGTLKRDEKFEPGFYFTHEDFLADDWIIEKKENK